MQVGAEATIQSKENLAHIEALTFAAFAGKRMVNCHLAAC